MAAEDRGRARGRVQGEDDGAGKGCKVAVETVRSAAAVEGERYGRAACIGVDEKVVAGARRDRLGLEVDVGECCRTVGDRLRTGVRRDDCRGPRRRPVGVERVSAPAPIGSIDPVAEHLVEDVVSGRSAAPGHHPCALTLRRRYLPKRPGKRVLTPRSRPANG